MQCYPRRGMGVNSSKRLVNFSLKFLITSRPYDEVEDRFKPITDFFLYIHLKGEEQNYQIYKEVNLVIRIRIKELAEIAFLLSNMQQ
ncbi:ankyrin repeat protein [Aspergillus lentulus]|nr:ankyrin repeat protein [Aspergillus lentulus]